MTSRQERSFCTLALPRSLPLKDYFCDSSSHIRCWEVSIKPIKLGYRARWEISACLAVGTFRVDSRDRISPASPPSKLNACKTTIAAINARWCASNTGYNARISGHYGKHPHRAVVEFSWEFRSPFPPLSRCATAVLSYGENLKTISGIRGYVDTAETACSASWLPLVSLRFYSASSATGRNCILDRAAIARIIHPIISKLQMHFQWRKYLPRVSAEQMLPEKCCCVLNSNNRNILNALFRVTDWRCTYWNNLFASCISYDLRKPSETKLRRARHNPRDQIKHVRSMTW